MWSKVPSRVLSSLPIPNDVLADERREQNGEQGTYMVMARHTARLEGGVET
jgi:hypothetical protein